MLKSGTLLNLKASFVVRHTSSMNSALAIYLPKISVCFQLQVVSLLFLLNCQVVCAGEQLLPSRQGLSLFQWC